MLGSPGKTVMTTCWLVQLRHILTVQGIHAELKMSPTPPLNIWLPFILRIHWQKFHVQAQSRKTGVNVWGQDGPLTEWPTQLAQRGGPKLLGQPSLQAIGSSEDSW